MSNIEVVFALFLALIWGAWMIRKFIRPYFGKKKNDLWLQKYQQKKRIQSALKLLNKVYANVNGHRVAKFAKLRRNIQSDSFLYGEIDFLAFMALMSYCSPTKEDVFFDLGSGAGKAVLSAALGFELKQAIGIELIPELVNLSNKLLGEVAGQSQMNCSPVMFLRDDILSADFSAASIVFINATAFQGQVWDNLLSKILQLAAGTRVVITSKRLPTSHFQIIYQGMEVMSWGMNSAFVYNKIL